MLRRFIAPAVFLLITYLSFSFVLMEWNPKMWSEGSRLVAACLGIWIAVVAYSASKKAWP